MTKDSISIFLHLLDEEGQIWAQKDNQPQGGNYLTSLWDEGEVVKDEYELIVKEETPPGEYLLEVGIYLLSTRERLPFLEGGKVVGDRILLGVVKVAHLRGDLATGKPNMLPSGS